MSYLSVILPCYNSAKYIGRCLDSVFCNAVNDTEIILVDDGSTDDFCEVIQAYFGVQLGTRESRFAYQQARIVVIRQENAGVSEARNAGLREATGEYIAFIDPDDYVDGHYFQEVREKLSAEQLDMLVFGYYREEEDSQGNIIKTVNKFPQKQYCYHTNAQIVENMLPGYLGISAEALVNTEKGRLLPQKELGTVWRCIYRRDFLIANQITFSPLIKVNEDGIFNSRCFAKAERVDTLMRCFYHYIIRPTGGAFANRANSYLVQNKCRLLEERMAIAGELQQSGYLVGVAHFAGSNILSVLEIMNAMPLSAWAEICEYLRHEGVKTSIKIMPYIHKIKFDIPLFLLKRNQAKLLFLCVRLAKKAGISIKI